MQLRVLGLQGATSIDFITDATRGMSVENVRAILSTTGLTQEEMKQVLVSHGVAEAEAEQTVATIAQSAANVEASVTTGGLTTATAGLQSAFKGLWATMKNNPYVWLVAIIGVFAVGLGKLSKMEENAQEKAREAAQEARELATQHSEETKTISDLISKYKELAESGIRDWETINQIKDIQGQLVELVGSQASGLDLVNGKLETQLGLLSHIKQEQATSYLPTYRDAYLKASEETSKINKHHSNLLYDWWEQDENTVTFDYWGNNKDRDIALKVINKAWKDRAFGEAESNFYNIVGFMDSYSQFKLDEKLSYAEWVDAFDVAISALENSDEIDYREVELYSKLVQFRNDFNNSITKQRDAANLVLKGLFDESFDFNKNISSYETYISYRDDIINDILNDDIIKQAIEDKVISNDSVEQFVYDQFAGLTQYEDYYKQWLSDEKIKEIATGISRVKSNYSRNMSRSKLDNPNMNSHEFLEYKKDEVDEFNDWINSLSDEDRSIVYDIYCNTYTADYTLEQWKKAVEDKRIIIGAEVYVSYMTKLDGLSDGFKIIDEVYADISDGEDFDYSKILNNEKFSEAFSELDSYNEFIKTVTNSTNDIKACQSAFNSLIDDYIFASGILGELTDETKDATVAYLEQQGVTNALEVVTEALNHQKTLEKIKSGELSKANEQELWSRYALVDAESAEKQAIAQLLIEKTKLNQNKIDTSAEIDGLIGLANSAKATTSSISNLIKAKELMIRAEDMQKRVTMYGEPISLKEITALKKEAYALAQQEIEYNPIDPNVFKYGGGSTSNKNDNSSDSSKSPETFDWIEVAIERVENAVSKLDSKANSTYKNWANRNKALKGQLSEIKKEISLQEKAYARYIKQADSVGLSSSWKKLVQEGKVDISTITDENLAEKISQYQEWYNKAIECNSAIDELHETLASLYEDNFNNIQEDFENQLELLEHSSNVYNSEIEALEAKGYLESAKYYALLQETERDRISLLNAELSSLETALKEAMASGEIEEGSSAWYEMQIGINGVKEEIDDATLSLIEYGKTMREIEWGYFDFTQDRISQLTNEAEFLIDLIGDSDLYDDKGQLSDKGMGVVGLHGLNYNVYMNQSEQYAKELYEIEKQLADDPYNTKLIERREELLELQQESILAAEDEKQAICEMVEEGIQLELDALKELIDTYTEALDSAKDLYDYQKNISDQTANIAMLQKQLSAYENDTSEEAKSRIQQLKVELAEAEEGLEETQYEQYISDQKKLLDELYLDYEEILNQRLDNIDVLFSEMIENTNINTESINTTLVNVGNDVGYTITENMQKIWDGSTNAINGTLSVYGDNFSESLTSTNIILSQIATNTDLMVKASDKETANDSISTPNSNNNSSASSNTTNNNSSTSSNVSTPSNNTNNGNKGNITIGSKINASGALIYGYAGDTNGSPQYFSDDPIYTVVGEQNGYLLVRWHELSSGYTGWFKKSDVKAYKTGGLVDYTGMAWLDGKPNKPELVLNAKDTANFISLNETLRAMSKQGLSIGVGSNYSFDMLPRINGLIDISSMLVAMRNQKSNEPTNSFGDINITIPIERVENYNDFVNQLSSDKKFEKMVQAMTVDRIVGGSSLAKNKYKW